MSVTQPRVSTTAEHLTQIYLAEVTSESDLAQTHGAHANENA
jgi:hypothetical protein